MKTLSVAVFLSSILTACTNTDSPGTNDNLTEEGTTAPIINYALVNTYPHDTTSFTEGLLMHNGQLYESTGSPDDMPQTRSLFGTLDLKTGYINKKVELNRDKYFGEGITFLHDKIYQLTYKTKTGFIYDAKTFEKLGEFSFPGKEGWGMTTDGTFLILTDGTNILYYLDASDFKTVKTVQVIDKKGKPVGKLNEAEYINNFIYANVYETNSIIKIDPASGNVVGMLDLSSLANEARGRYPGSMEMNGIAYDSILRKVYITGKMWPTLYEIQFSH
jgi:glutamine cyclotransferase